MLALLQGAGGHGSAPVEQGARKRERERQGARKREREREKGGGERDRYRLAGGRLCRVAVGALLHERGAKSLIACTPTKLVTCEQD